MKIIEFIKKLKDPRLESKVKHNFGSIIFVTLCGILSGCESWIDIEAYCEGRRNWLGQYVDLSNGTPSGNTFRRIFILLAPECIEQLLRTHAASIISKGTQSDQIAIDGKTLCGSRRQGMQCLQSISAWCHSNSLVLAQKQVESGSNEVAAIPLLIESLNLKGNTVSIDAAGCQKAITKTIKDKEGDYVIGLKKNQPKLYKAVQNHIKLKGENNDNRLHDTFDESHNRTVRRRYFGYDVTSLPEIEGFISAKSVIAVESISSQKNDPERNVKAQWRYYITSHVKNNKQLHEYVRNHWGIENKLHWILDVHFKEDDDRKAECKSAISFANLRRIALNIIRSSPEPISEKKRKRSLKGKMRRCRWDEDYLLALLS
jgi:predicted transposase YbfD/YdcC